MKFDAPKAPLTRGAARLPSPRSANAKPAAAPGPGGGLGSAPKAASGPMVVSGRLIGIVFHPRPHPSATTRHDDKDDDETGQSVARTADRPAKSGNGASRRNRKLH